MNFTSGVKTGAERTSGVATSSPQYAYFRGRTVHNRQESTSKRTDQSASRQMVEVMTSKEALGELKSGKTREILSFSKENGRATSLKYTDKRQFLIAFQKYNSKRGLQLGKMNFQKDRCSIKFIFIEGS